MAFSDYSCIEIDFGRISESMTGMPENHFFPLLITARYRPISLPIIGLNSDN